MLKIWVLVFNLGALDALNLYLVKYDFISVTLNKVSNP